MKCVRSLCAVFMPDALDSALWLAKGEFGANELDKSGCLKEVRKQIGKNNNT